MANFYFLKKELLDVKILGIDPGYAIVGYGAIVFAANKFQPLCYGAIQTEANLPFYDRLSTIYKDMNELLEKVRPDAMAVKKTFF